jgi:predicted metalloprotease
MGGAPIAILFWLFSRFGLPGVLVGGIALYLFSGSLSAVTGGGSRSASGAPTSQAEQDAGSFMSFAFDDVQKTWAQGFQSAGAQYQKARMVLFRGTTRSGCGVGQRQMGPFYCPADQQVYLDLDFFQDLHGLGKTGDLAQAYVVAHEVGHHVQHLLGTDARMQNAPARMRQGPESASVRLELQADCYAGIWMRAARERNLLESGDVEGALAAAARIGDDYLQKEATGTVQPERWTHGSSEARERWLKKGIESGDLRACDTFTAQQL